LTLLMLGLGFLVIITHFSLYNFFEIQITKYDYRLNLDPDNFE